MWQAALLLVLGLGVYGSGSWKLETKDIHKRLEKARVELKTDAFDSVSLEGLPAPVKNYLSTVLTEGQAMVTKTHIRHSGTFNMSADGEDWKKFTSRQVAYTSRPGFDWEGRIFMAPGMKARVHDAYIAGEGILHASLFGLLSVAKLQGGREIAEGELMRFLAESVWYPTILLPGNGITWEAVDKKSAMATLNDGELSVSLLFGFGEDGLVNTVYSVARGRMVGKEMEMTPWKGEFSNYQRRDGILVPLDGAVGWELENGFLYYWRGTIEEISYEF